MELKKWDLMGEKEGEKKLFGYQKLIFLFLALEGIYLWSVTTGIILPFFVGKNSISDAENAFTGSYSACIYIHLWDL